MGWDLDFNQEYKSFSCTLGAEINMYTSSRLVTQKGPAGSYKEDRAVHTLAPRHRIPHSI